jgi:phosphogluconate dehydratase
MAASGSSRAISARDHQGLGGEAGEPDRSRRRRVFHDQEELNAAFKAGELDGDMVAVVRYQGPKANGMPELHRLTTVLGICRIAATRSRWSPTGACRAQSGKVPAAIHVTPEALDGGPIGRLRDGDMVRLDAEAGTLEALVDEAEFAARETVLPDLSANGFGMGRELFEGFRRMAGRADAGAAVF